MAFTPSIGDIMMLSQLAWKIGCAFTSGRGGAPAEFKEVKDELTSLTKSIDMLAEALDKDDSMITRADAKTREGLDKILECCRQTLQNLESFVDQYQEVQKPDDEGSGGVRRWKPILIRNYKKIWWTTEGGNIQALRNMLQMHVHSISLTVHALQSKSLSRLENTIEPMASKVEGIHDKLNGDLDVKVAEIHHLMLSMAAMDRSPRLDPQDLSSISQSQPISPPLPIRHPDRVVSGPYDYNYKSQKTPEVARSDFSLRSSKGISQGSANTVDYDQPPSDLRHSDRHYRLPSYSEGPPEYREGRQSAFSNINTNQLIESPQSPKAEDLRTPSLASLGILPLAPVTLPPPILTPDHELHHESYDSPRISVLAPASEVPRVLSTLSKEQLFDQKLFADSEILCEARATAVEFTQADPENPANLRMVEAVSLCRILVATKKQELSSESTRYVTSIWAISDDHEVRVQQKLADGEEVIPYTVWGNETKVVLRVPAELKFHDVELNSKPVQVSKTNWINYVFEDEKGSILFQNVLMGKTLLLSVKTKRTLRIHDGLVANTFTFQEQICGLENLRFWQDDDMAGVLAMIHFSPHFRDGYLAFRLNCPPRNTIRVRDDGERTVRIKGLNVTPVGSRGTFERAGVADVNKSLKPKIKGEKKISAVKIEFDTDTEKRIFLDKVREIQGSATW